MSMHKKFFPDHHNPTRYVGFSFSGYYSIFYYTFLSTHYIEYTDSFPIIEVLEINKSSSLSKKDRHKNYTDETLKMSVLLMSYF